MNNARITIVALDGHTLNPGDLSWNQWQEYGEITVFPRTPADTDSIVARCSGADAILTNKVPLTAEALARLPSLRYIDRKSVV